MADPTTTGYRVSLERHPRRRGSALLGRPGPCRRGAGPVAARPCLSMGRPWGSGQRWMHRGGPAVAVSARYPESMGGMGRPRSPATRQQL